MPVDSKGVVEAHTVPLRVAATLPSVGSVVGRIEDGGIQRGALPQPEGREYLKTIEAARIEEGYRTLR